MGVQGRQERSVPRSSSAHELLVVGTVQARLGTVATGHLRIGKLLDGTEVALPLILVNGARPGPVLGLFACMYGNADEQIVDTGYEQGIEVVRRLTRETVDPRSLRGGIIASPLINPMAFNARTMMAVEDRIDLQQVFPGNPDGTLSERAAHLVFHECIRQCNAVINLHAKDDIDWSVVFTHPNQKIYQQSWELARAYGTPTIGLSHKALPRSLCVAAMDLGIPAFISEPVWPPLPGRGVGPSIRGVLNVMKHLGMLEGELEPQSDNPIPFGFYDRVGLRTKLAGIVQPFKEPGDRVAKDEVVAIVRDVLGNVLEEIRSPAECYYRITVKHRVVLKGLVGELFVPRPTQPVS